MTLNMTLNGKEIADMRIYGRGVEPYVDWALYITGEVLSDAELDDLEDKYREEIQYKAYLSRHQER